MTTQESNARASRTPIARSRRARKCRLLFATTFAAVLVGIGGCGPVQLVANSRIPTPLVVKLPVTVALFMPQQFAQYVHKEERWGTDWNIDIGKAQSDAMSQLMNAMFDKVIVVDSVAAGGAMGAGVTAILEPSVEEYAFVTPRDAGSPFFAVSIKYRVNVYTPDGKLADSWGFTGYGTSPAGGLSNTEPLQNATALAMRDAGAKLVVEFRDQPVVRGLFPGAESADDPPGPTPASSDESEVATPGSASDPANPAPTSGAPDPSGAAPTSVPAADPASESQESEKNEEESDEEQNRVKPDVEAFALSMVRRE